MLFHINKHDKLNYMLYSVYLAIVTMVMLYLPFMCTPSWITMVTDVTVQ